MRLKGLTLIELIAFIVVLGIGIPPLLIMLGDINTKTERSMQLSKMYSSVTSLLEEILSKKFDENIQKPWSNPLGPDADETDKEKFDDVDDFDNYTDSYLGLSRKVLVYYVNPDLTSSEPPYHLDTVQPDSSNDLDYKRIDVEVTHSLVGTIKVSTVVSSGHLVIR
jgi:MSHA pilin protein MshD